MLDFLFLLNLDKTAQILLKTFAEFRIVFSREMVFSKNHHVFSQFTINLWYYKKGLLYECF